ncbi:MAG: bifunctional proline dehydrogenase/L-glutamate gamma-semialdehyde dehydrogenase PutA [Hydrogenophilaceae bacterium]|jgi:RHH-type proline utilization regulon transcriptional repressor/proline dehydrogenase/delta 1-pyrroline-5-carboxylate dehydrogenase|nr:bifunctional proline dehydrogenase/L-glutamate gamma-semialdehyde dehydrogenase PutA [Hydrogenophilaceae bacterium]
MAESASAAFDWNLLDQDKYADENRALERLLTHPPLDAAARASVAAEARALVVKARDLKRRKGVMESFLEEFGLSNSEGLALMCLAEALLRVPDEDTADKLIAEKIATGRWEDHLGKSDHWLVNAGTWGLMLTGRIVTPPDDMARDAGGFMKRLVARVGEPVVRAGAMQAMRILGEQFVLGRTIEAAIRRGRGHIRQGLASAFSFDMLGEGARTAGDAARYLDAYAHAIEAVGEDAGGRGPIEASGVSVKLSALFPRYEARQEERVMAELLPRALALAERAKAYGVGLTLDAEEADRLVLSLKLLDALSAAPSLSGWDGLGLAVQAYQKRALAVIEAVQALATRRRRRLMVRLVKGAYWDGEIKRAQVMGRADFPVFTTKAATDVNYLACARAMLAAPSAIYPQFATHNAHTAAAVKRMAELAGVKDYEFQRLHGMGEALYAAFESAAPVRVYAPVGGHEDLLPYLVRRLLENGANTSFVHSFLDEDVSPELVAADPLAHLEAQPRRHPRLPPPPALYGASRRNSSGRDLSIAADRDAIVRAIAQVDGAVIDAASLIGTVADSSGAQVEMRAPADASRIVGRAHIADAAMIDAAIARACAAQKAWNDQGGVARAAILRKMGDALEADADRFVALIAREGGRTLQDGIDEVREAADFCRYYAADAERQFAGAAPLPGPAGETNALELHGRGVFVCISPWNFPLAIFTGQIAAALAAGNCVVAKPAEQTPIIAHEAVKLFRAAGLPADVLSLCLGAGDVGAALVADPRIAGVAFTGSTEVAQRINRALAAREGPIATLIAETGGLNGLFVDTTALKEQVVDDVILSAFGSAGQRCSALRLLFLPRQTADEIIEGLKGALEELRIGDPADPRTDVGPVIDAEAKAALEAHMARMAKEARVIAQRDVAGLNGSYFGPAIVELPRLDLIAREVFGPVLHIVRYDPAEIAQAGAALAAKGYGLTLGVHSRLSSFADAVMDAVPAGNVYVNRSIIGAVVGVQPFGGLGLSGTGPKAGGPHYLPRFATERTVTVNIAAQGGDPALLNL